MAAGLTDHVWTFRELLTAKFEPLESQSISQCLCSCSWGKKAPALTVAQLRWLLEGVLPWRTYRIADVLEVIAWRQRCNHRAYLSQKKRRETEG